MTNRSDSGWGYYAPSGRLVLFIICSGLWPIAVIHSKKASSSKPVMACLRTPFCVLPPQFKLYSHIAPLRVRSYSSKITDAAVAALHHCSGRITPWPFSKIRFLLLFSYRSSLFRNIPFVLTNSSCWLYFFMPLFIFKDRWKQKKSFYQHLLIKGRSLVLPPFVQKVSLPSTQRLSRKFHQEIGAPFNGRADSVIAYLSTINPPRPFFNVSDLTLSTNQSLSLKYLRLLSLSTDSYSCWNVLYRKKDTLSIRKLFFFRIFWQC